MKGNTKVAMGIRHVGDANHEDEISHGPMIDQIKTMARFMAANSMATRFEFVFARTELEVFQRFADKTRVNQSTMRDDKLDGMLNDMFGDSFEEESNAS